jgi:hypothetical protein
MVSVTFAEYVPGAVPAGMISSTSNDPTDPPVPAPLAPN